MQAVYSYLRANCVLVLLDILDRLSILVKVNLNARGFSEFTSLTLPLHICPDKEGY